MQSYPFSYIWRRITFFGTPQEILFLWHPDLISLQTWSPGLMALSPNERLIIWQFGNYESHAAPWYLLLVKYLGHSRTWRTISIQDTRHLLLHSFTPPLTHSLWTFLKVYYHQFLHRLKVKNLSHNCDSSWFAYRFGAYFYAFVTYWTSYQQACRSLFQYIILQIARLYRIFREYDCYRSTYLLDSFLVIDQCLGI